MKVLVLCASLHLRAAKKFHATPILNFRADGSLNPDRKKQANGRAIPW